MALLCTHNVSMAQIMLFTFYRSLKWRFCRPTHLEITDMTKQTSLQRTTASLAIVGIAAALAGCGESPLGASGTEDSAIDASMNDSYSQYFSPEMVETDGAVYTGDPSDGGETAPALAADENASLPVAWGRKPGGPVRRVVDRFYPDRNHAEVTTTRVREGRLFVDRSDDEIRNGGIRPFADQWRRRSTMVKDGEEWILESISPASVRPVDASQSAYIDNVTIWVDGEEALNLSDPTTMLSFPDELPRLDPGQNLRVEVTAGNLDSEWSPSQWVFMRLDKKRHRMSDRGEFGDTTPEDGVYTLELDAPSEHSIWRVVVDVVEAGTLMSETGDEYGCVGWGIPFYSEDRDRD